MKRFLRNTSCALAICFASPAFALDDEETEKTNPESTGQVVIQTVQVVEEETEEGEDGTSQTIRIEINGDEHDVDIEKHDGKVVQKIREVIKDGQHEATIEATIVGRGVIIGPDGEKKEFNFGDPAANNESLKNLPNEIRIRVEKAIKDATNRAGLGQGIMIGPDGAKKYFKLGENPQFNEALKNLPEEARKRVEEAMKNVGNISIRSTGGRAIVIDANGEKKEIRFGDGDFNEEIDVQVMSELPKAIQQKIQRTKQAQARSERNGDSLAEKLDLILQRLDKIEAEIDELKKSE